MTNRTMALAVGLGLALAGGAAHAQRLGPDAERFRANEFSLDLFGTGSVGRQTINNLSADRVNDNGHLGAGFGLNYFATRYVGVMADAYTESTAGSWIDNASVNLVLRLPLGHSGFAPYIFGGGTRQFDETPQWGGQAGGGLEYRFTTQVGVFVDARYVFPDRTDNYGVARAGLRVSF